MKKKNDHHFDLPLFFNISMQFLAPGLGVWEMKVFKLVSCDDKSEWVWLNCLSNKDPVRGYHGKW